MAAKTDYQKLQARAKKLDIPANQSSEELEKAIAAAGASSSRPPASKKGKQASPSEEGPPLSEHGGVSPEWHNDPERVLDAAQLEARSELEERGEVKVSTFSPTTHTEMVIDFTGLQPDTDFEVKISGPAPSNYWTTLKSDPWGQAQLIWRTQAGGDYKISGKGPGINVDGEFSVTALDEDAEYRRDKRARLGKGKGKRSKAGNIGTVEEPGVMGDTPSGEQKAQPTKEELDDPAKFDPSFKTAEHDPADQGDPTINKEPHPKGSAQFNYRVPGEPETVGEESKEGDPETTGERQGEAKEEAAAETAKAEAAAETPAGEVSPNAGMSSPKSNEQIDREDAHTGADEASR